MTLQKKNILLPLIIIFCFAVSGCGKQNNNIAIIGGSDGPTRIFITSSKPTPITSFVPTPYEWNIPRVVSSSDKDGDGLNDTDDILEGARKDAENKPIYTDGYHNGGYPPDDEGVCTDVIWRAFKNAGYILILMIL